MVCYMLSLHPKSVDPVDSPLPVVRDTPGFLSLPCLSLAEKSKAKKHLTSLHTAKTLLQHHFRFDEYALDNDESSILGTAGKQSPGTILQHQYPMTVFVDELWGLCLDERQLPVYKVR